MSIKNSLRDLSVAMGGAGTATSVDGLLSEIALVKNPLAGLKIDTEVAADTDLLGKVIGDLQSGVVIRGNIVSGVLNKITDYTGFSGLEAEQSGHYLVVHASVPGQNGVTISVSKDGGTTYKALDGDGILIFRTTSASQKLTFKAVKGGSTDFIRTYRLSGLTLK